MRASFSVIGCFLLLSAFSDGRVGIVKLIQEKHKAELFHAHKAIAFDVHLDIKGRPHTDLQFVSLTNSGNIKMMRSDGTTVLFKNGVFSVTGKTQDALARFDALGWHYFFMVAFKLQDQGVQIEDLEDRNLEKARYRCGKMYFKSGTGETPKDWYLLFANKQNSRLEAMAFNATNAGSLTQPAAIRYSDWQSIGGVPYATTWNFHQWNDARGFGKLLGTARVDHVRWVEETEGIFETPPSNR
jgi:hypothetical protein